MKKPPKPYGIGLITKHGICIYQEYQTIGAAIDGMIRMQTKLGDTEKVMVFKHIEGERYEYTDFLNHALNKLVSVVRP